MIHETLEDLIRIHLFETLVNIWKGTSWGYAPNICCQSWSLSQHLFALCRVRPQTGRTCKPISRYTCLMRPGFLDNLGTLRSIILTRLLINLVLCITRIIIDLLYLLILVIRDYLDLLATSRYTRGVLFGDLSRILYFLHILLRINFSWKIQICFLLHHSCSINPRIVDDNRPLTNSLNHRQWLEVVVIKSKLARQVHLLKIQFIQLIRCFLCQGRCTCCCRFGNIVLLLLLFISPISLVQQYLRASSIYLLRVQMSIRLIGSFIVKHILDEVVPLNLQSPLTSPLFHDSLLFIILLLEPKHLHLLHPHFWLQFLKFFCLLHNIVPLLVLFLLPIDFPLLIQPVVNDLDFLEKLVLLIKQLVLLFLQLCLLILVQSFLVLLLCIAQNFLLKLLNLLIQLHLLLAIFPLIHNLNWIII